MRMFLSVSGHSSELSIANHSSRSSVSQLKCVSDTISSWFENHEPQKTKISTVLSFKTRIKWPLGWPQPQVFRGYFFNSCNFQGNVQAFRLSGLLWWQKLTIFPAFSSRFVHFAVQFCFRRKFSFNDERRSSQVCAWVWQWRDFSRPITVLCYA